MGLLYDCLVSIYEDTNIGIDGHSMFSMIMQARLRKFEAMKERAL